MPFGLAITFSALLAVATGLIILIFPKITRLVLGLFLVSFGISKMLGY